MPLKKSQASKTVKAYSGDEGSHLKLDVPMSLFDQAKLPAVTLHADQFVFPKNFAVVDAKRVKEFEINQETGWALKDSSGNKKPTGNYFVKLMLVDGVLAQQAIDSGSSLSGLSTVQCTVHKDIPLQNFVPNETLVELIKPNVMLGFGGQQADRIVLVAEDCKEV